MISFGKEEPFYIQKVTLNFLDNPSEYALYAWNRLGFDKDDGKLWALICTDGTVIVIEGKTPGFEFTDMVEFVDWLDDLGYTLAPNC